LSLDGSAAAGAATANGEETPKRGLFEEGMVDMSPFCLHN
jgi:hypothetical protein